ncbi:peptide transporter MTD1 [Coprinopsis sp. MPI-PUGE-AT-0042]|nr:peptide transporter MTD1 [Coprinopsis sp. MPI-PUGE-AT-0042]
MLEQPTSCPHSMVSLTPSFATGNVVEGSIEKGDTSPETVKAINAADDSAHLPPTNVWLSNGLLFDERLDTSLRRASSTTSAIEFSVVEPYHGSPLTLRAFIIGSLVACLGAAMYQVYVLKPVLAAVSNTFLILAVYIIGVCWSTLLPSGEQHNEKAPRQTLSSRFLHVLNPGCFGFSEHAVASMIAMAGANGNLAVQTLSVQYLYYSTKVDTITSILFIFSTSCFGCAIAGLYRKLTVEPSEYVYPCNLPILGLLQSLHKDRRANQTTIKWFSLGFWSMFTYEILPAYIFPLLNGLNVFCMASETSSSEKLKDAFTSLFGGAGGNEGLGLFSLSFDWQFIGSSFVHLPITYQANAWIGYVLCYGAVMAIYYSDVWNALSLPILSTTVFYPNGTVYDQATILDEHFNIVMDATKINGLPQLTGSFLWANIASNLGVGSLIAHVLCFIGFGNLFPFLSLSRKPPAKRVSPEANGIPSWWYTVLAFLSFFGGLAVMLRQNMYLSQLPFLSALVVGVLLLPFANSINAYIGHWILPTHVAKMVGSLLLPGDPLGILYFSTWSEAIVANGMFFTAQLKLGQHLKIPARILLFTQIWGLLLGGLVNYAVMTRIVEHQADTFTGALGTNVWNGQVAQILNSEVITWSLAKELYSWNGPYFIVPLSLLLGASLTGIRAFLHWLWPQLWLLDGSILMLPVVFMYSSIMTFGITSSVISTVVVGVVSQLWIRRRFPSWYNNESLIFSSALDGGAQTMLLLLSFTALGGIKGAHRPFLEWIGNPTKGNVDYCNGNGVLSL